MAARLLTLASGRIPLPARLLAWAGAALLAGAWILLDPGHTSQPRLQPQPPRVLMLDARSPWVDRAELTDPASLFLRPPADLGEVPVTAQPEATPFLAFGPDLRAQPGQPLVPRPTPSAPSSESPIGLLLNSEALPLRTLGRAPASSPPTQRKPLVEVISDSGETLFTLEVGQDSQGKILFKSLENNVLKINFCPEFRLGIDAFGQQARPFMTLSSGDAALDQAALAWVSEQDWRRHLPPGSYRLRLGP